MPKRKIRVVQVRQRETPGGGGAPVEHDLLTGLTAVRRGANFGPVRVAVELTGTFTGRATRKPVTLSLILTKTNPAGATAEAQKRHQPGDVLFTVKQRILIGAFAPGNVDEHEIEIPKREFDEPDTVYIIRVASADGLAVGHCMVFRN